MTSVGIDFETRSDVNLKTHGLYVYFASPHARVLIGSYMIDDGPVKRWELGQPMPTDLRQVVQGGATIRAVNAAFEIRCFEWLAQNEGWHMPASEQFECTAAKAAAMSLPRDLAGMGAALGLDIQKDKEGQRLIRKFSIPRSARKDEDPAGVYWNEPADHPEDWAKFKDYCDVDVIVEAGADRRMVALSDYEQRVWQMSETINRRGIRIDRTSAVAALKLAERAKVKLDAEMRRVTNGAVGACSQVAKLVEWVQAQGVALTSAARTEISDLLADVDDLPERVKEALALRQEGSKTSITKLRAMLNRADDDGRVRGSFMYHAAGTGRFQSMGVNFANLPRPRPLFDAAGLRRDVLFEAVRSGDPDRLTWLYEAPLARPIDLVSDSIRGFIWSAPGRELIQADYSGIEGAVIAWLAGETWKLEALFEIMRDPSLPDMYRRAAAGIMNLSTEIVTKKHPLRQSVGKVSELALGFQGGVTAFFSMARTYNMRLAELHALYEPVWNAADEETRERAVKRYEKCLKRKESHADVLSREAWLACEIVKVGWRKTNPAIAKSWRDAESAIRGAVQDPGTVTEAARVKLVVSKGFLWAQLPSGRCLAYGAPKLKDQVWAKQLDPAGGGWMDAEVMDRDLAEKGSRMGVIRIEGETSPRVTVLGSVRVGDRSIFQRYALYGGLAMENWTQATARDLLVNGMFKAEAAGYPIVAHVYDEIIAEVPNGWGDLKAFEKLICELPDWAEGLPLTAGGWRGKRYRKD